MQRLVRLLSTLMSVLAGIVLLSMTGLTFVDVVLRYFGRPLVGTYELVAFLGVAVAALALPRASLLSTHVYVDLVVDKLSGRWRKIFRVFTRLVVFVMFLIAGWYFVFMAGNFVATKTVTMTLKVPFYPVVYALAASSVIQCLVNVCEIFDEIRRPR
jgi:TRAP-type C4-dicarboxylate transport system permease small subunit